MNTPTSGGHDALRSVVSGKMETFAVTRQTHSSGAMGGSESESEHEAEIFVGSPNEIAEDTEYGERLTGTLSGLTYPGEDIEEGDRITYQEIPYEVSETITSDSDTGDTLLMLNLVRVTNED